MNNYVSITDVSSSMQLLIGLYSYPRAGALRLILTATYALIGELDGESILWDLLYGNLFQTAVLLE